MRFAFLLIAALAVSGCTAQVDNSTATRDQPTPLEPSVSPPLTPTTERVEGKITRTVQITAGPDTHSVAPEGKESFSVDGAVTRIELVLTWTPTAPSTSTIEVALGQEGGGIVARATGSSPLRIEVDGSNLGTGDVWILISSPAPAGGMVSQTFEWQADLTRDET